MDYSSAMRRAEWGESVRVGIMTATGILQVSLDDLKRAQWSIDANAPASSGEKYLGEMLRMEQERCERLGAELSEAKAKLAESQVAHIKRDQEERRPCCACCACGACMQRRQMAAMQNQFGCR